MKGLSVIDTSLLDDVAAEARSSRRRRHNRNLHASDNEPCNRLLNAVEPDSYVPPHRHLDPAKDETFAVLRGRFGVIVFDNAGGVHGQHWSGLIANTRINTNAKWSRHFCIAPAIVRHS